MAASVRQLRFSDLFTRRAGSLAFRLLLAVFDISLKLFFRRIETVNIDTVPARGSIIFVLNHPNGLIDPALVFTALPRKISFLAKSTLFSTPVISFMLRTAEALPLYRRIDPGEDISRNERTFEICRDLLQRGGSIALFPEGISHNSPKLLPAKTGAARIALGAASIGGDGLQIGITIVPVGLYYTNKTTFRSEALLYFGEGFAVGPVRFDDDGQPPREKVRELTTRIEDALRDVTLNAETESELSAAQIAESVFSTALENENIAERFDFLKNYIEEKRHGIAGEDEGLKGRIGEYDRRLRERGLDAEHLSLAQFSRGFVVKYAIVRTWWLIVLLPLSVAGIVLHFPAYQICKLLAYLFTHHGADDIVSTVKVLAAMLFMPLTWLAAAIVVYLYFGWEAAALSVPAAFICGYAALYSLEEFEELRGWTKAVWVFLTDRDAFLRLFVERRNLQAELKDLQTGRPDGA